MGCGGVDWVLGWGPVTALDDRAVLARLETYYDAAPRGNADTEEVGPFTLFRSLGGWPYYARPRLTCGDPLPVDEAAVRTVLDRQRELRRPPLARVGPRRHPRPAARRPRRRPARRGVPTARPRRHAHLPRPPGRRDRPPRRGRRPRAAARPGPRSTSVSATRAPRPATPVRPSATPSRPRAPMTPSASPTGSVPGARCSPVRGSTAPARWAAAATTPARRRTAS